MKQPLNFIKDEAKLFFVVADQLELYSHSRAVEPETTGRLQTSTSWLVSCEYYIFLIFLFCRRVAVLGISLMLMVTNQPLLSKKVVCHSKAVLLPACISPEISFACFINL